MNESAGAVEMERTCKKCGGVDFRPNGKERTGTTKFKCWDCNLENRRKRYAARPDVRAKLKEYNKAHPEQCANYRRASWVKHGKKYAERMREKRAENGDAIRESQRKRYHANPEKSRAKSKERWASLTVEQKKFQNARSRAKRLIKDPNADKKHYENHRRYNVIRSRVNYWKDPEYCRRKAADRAAKRSKNSALLDSEKANQQIKEIAMTKHLTFAQQAKSMTTQQLFTEFNTCTIRVSEGLYRMAVLWVELENRGENLSVIKTPFRQFFPDIASGRLLPEVVLEYGGAPKKLEIFSTLVAEDQRRLASEDAAVPLVVRTASGAAEVRTVNPHEMRLSEIRQVFGEGRIRTPSEQQRFVPATIAEQQPVAAPSLFNEEAFDLLAELTAQQRRDLSTLAFSRGMTPAEFVVDLLVRTKAVTKATSRATTESRATG